MTERTRKILQKASQLASAWHDEAVCTFGHEIFIQRAMVKRRKLFDFLEAEFEQLVRESETKTNTMTKDIYLNTCISKEQNDALLKDHSNLVVLTPDDTITLKLVKERLAADLFNLRQAYARYEHTADRQLVLETLERILKQVV